MYRTHARHGRERSPLPGLAVFALVGAFALGLGCGDDAASGADSGPGPQDGGVDGSVTPTDGSVTPTDGAVQPDANQGTVAERARALAQDLRGHANFLIGLGNDNAAPYDHSLDIDLHYAYLVGYGDDGGGWPNWNAGGAYVDAFAADADAAGITPMFTYYQMALELENGNVGVFTDAGRMRQYLLDFRLLYERLAAFDRPAVVTIEPDFFGYLENHVRDSGVPADQMPALLHHADFHDCDALPETVAGFTECLVVMARAIAPKVRVGFHASRWGAWFDATDPSADVEGAGQEVGEFLLSVGAATMDFVGIETLDRDAGFWETSGGGNTCSVTDGSRGPVYWDASNATLPNFQQHFRWVGAVTAATGLPALWWQTPLGEPSTQCGGSTDHWRDNRVSYFFSHVQELIDAGGVGAAFGTGAGEQTHIGTDNDQFKDASDAYMASPVPL